MSQLPDSSLPPTSGTISVVEPTSFSLPTFPSDTASSSPSVPASESSSSSVETPINTSATGPSESVTQPASPSTDSSVEPIQTTITASPTNVTPVGGISSHKSANAGAIAGAVIGVLGLLALLLGAFLLYRRRRRGRPLLPTRALSSGSGRSSSERKGPPMAGRPSHPHHNTSVGTFDGTAEDTLDGHLSLGKNFTWDRSASGEKTAYQTSPPLSTDEHGLSTSVGSTGAETLAGSADLSHVQAYYARSRHGSAQSSVTTIAEQPYGAEPVSRSNSRRRSSRRESAGPGWSPALVSAPRPTGAGGERERVLSAPTATTYPPGAPRRHASANSVGSVLEQHTRASSFDRSTTSLAGAGGSNPQLVAAPAPTGVARAPSAARRPKKKPVPRYSVDPSAPASGELSPSTPATPVGFDGRPVHYLIPDMPVEQH